MLRKSCVLIVLAFTTSGLFAEDKEQILLRRLDEAQNLFTEFDRISNQAILAANNAKKYAELSKELFLKSPGDLEKLKQALLAEQDARILEKEWRITYVDYLFVKAFVQSIQLEIEELNELKARQRYEKLYELAHTDKSKQTFDEVLKARRELRSSEFERFKAKQAAENATAEYESALKTLGPFTEDYPPEEEKKDTVVWI